MMMRMMHGAWNVQNKMWVVWYIVVFVIVVVGGGGGCVFVLRYIYIYILYHYCNNNTQRVCESDKHCKNMGYENNV